MPKSRAFVGQLLDLNAAFGIVDAMRAIGRRHIVIDDGERLLRRPHFAAGEPQPLEGLRARHFMNKMPVDIEKAGAVLLTIDHMVFEDLVVERLRLGHRLSLTLCRWRERAATLGVAGRRN